MKKIFNSWFLTHLQKLRNISDFNRDLLFPVRTNGKPTKVIFNEVIPKKGDFELGNEAKSSVNWHNYKKKLFADFITFRNTEGSNGWHQITRHYDDHLNKRREMPKEDFNSIYKS